MNKNFYELLIFWTIHCTMAMDIFYIYHCNWQLKYKVFWFTTFVRPVVIYKRLFEYCNAQLFHAVVIFITFSCNVTLENVYSYYSNKHLLYWLLVDTLQLATHFYICWLLNAPWYWQLFYALLQLATIVWTIGSDDYCIMQNKIKNISYIDCHNKHKFISAL